MKAIKWNCLLISMTIILFACACGEKKQETISETEIIVNETEHKFVTESESTMEEETGSADSENIDLENPESLQSQLKVMAKSIDLWRKIAENLDLGGFTVTDLDRNGRYELILGAVAGSGAYTYGCFFEVNETYDGLINCADDRSYWDPWADYIDDEVSVYYDSNENIYYYIIEDYVRYGGDGHYFSIEAYLLQNGQIHINRIAAHESVWSRDEEKTETIFWNGLDETITEEEYIEIINNPFPEFESQTLVLNWSYGNLYEMDEATFLTELEALCSEEAE